MRYADWTFDRINPEFGEGYYPVNHLEGDESIGPDNVGHDTIDHLFLGYRVGGPMAELKALGSIKWRKPNVDMTMELAQVITLYSGGIDFYGVKKESPLLPDLVKSVYDYMESEGATPNEEVWDYIQKYGQQFLDAGRIKAQKLYGDVETANHAERQVIQLFTDYRKSEFPIRFVFEFGDVYVSGQ